jgi:hypothetical protein
MFTYDQPHNTFDVMIARLLEPGEVADMLKVSLKTVPKLVREKRPPCVSQNARKAISSD